MARCAKPRRLAFFFSLEAGSHIAALRSGNARSIVRQSCDRLVRRPVLPSGKGLADRPSRTGPNGRSRGNPSCQGALAGTLSWRGAQRGWLTSSPVAGGLATHPLAVGQGRRAAPDRPCPCPRGAPERA